MPWMPCAASRAAVRSTSCSPTSIWPGAWLARRARQLLPDLPVIYTSGRCAMDRQERVEGAMFVPKPYDAFSIGRLLNQLIAAKGARAQSFA